MINSVAGQQKILMSGDIMKHVETQRNI